MTDFLNYLILGLTRGSTYALIALGYTLVYGVLQLINFAHSEVFMSGAFGSFLIVHLIVGSGKGTATWAVPFIIIIGMVSGAVTAAAIALYEWLGFLATMSLLLFSLVFIVERKPILPAAVFSVGVTVFAYVLFGTLLKSPLPRGIFWF